MTYDTYIVGRLFDSLGNPAIIHAAGSSQQRANNLEFRIDASSQPLTGPTSQFHFRRQSRSGIN